MAGCGPNDIAEMTETLKKLTPKTPDPGEWHPSPHFLAYIEETRLKAHWVE